MPNTNREPAWDLIRVYAALGVVLAHISSSLTHGGVSLNYIFANLLDTLSRPAVGLFFIMSGMFALAKYDAFRSSQDKLSFIARYYARSFTRTILPAGVSIVFYTVLIGGRYDALSSLTGFVNMFRFDSILSSPGYHLWFMYVLFWMILITPLLWILLGAPAGKTILHIGLFLWCALAVVLTSCYYYLNVDRAKLLVDFFNAHPMLKHIGYFLLGAYLPKLRCCIRENEAFKKAVEWVFAVSVLITSAIPYILLYGGIDDPWHSYRDFERLNIVLLTVSTFLIICRPRYKENPWEEPARTTFGVYLSHVFFIWCLNPGIKSLEYELPVIGIVIEAAIVVACSYGFGRLYAYAASNLSSILSKPWGKREEEARIVPRNELTAQVTQPSRSPYDIYGIAPAREKSGVPQERRDYIARARFEGLRNAEDTPVLSKVVLCLTHRCQYSCVMCKRGGAMEERDPSFWLEVIDSTRRPDIEFVLFGGEPGLYEGFDTVFDYLASQNKKFRFTVVSNGGVVQRFAERFWAADNAMLTLSVDGFAKEHNAIRGNSQAFQRVEDFLRCTAKAEPSALERVAINCVIQPLNLSTPDYLPALVNCFYNLGVKNIRLQHMQSPPLLAQRKTIEMWEVLFPDETITLPMPGCGVDLRLTQPLLGNLREALLKIKRQYPKSYVLPDLSCQGRDLERYYLDPEGYAELDSVEGFCLRPFTSPFILPNGAVSLCPLGGYQTEKLAKGASFGRVWNGERAREFRKAVLDHTFPICKFCCDNYQ